MKENLANKSILQLKIINTNDSSLFRNLCIHTNKILFFNNIKKKYLKFNCKIIFQFMQKEKTTNKNKNILKNIMIY